MDNKAFGKLVNNRFVGYLGIYGLFFDFQYGFRFSQSTADFLTVVSDRISRAYNRSGATVKYLIYPRPLTGFDMLVFFTNLCFMEFQGSYLALFCLFFRSRQLRMVLDGTSSHKYLVNAGVPPGSILSPTLF